VKDAAKPVNAKLLADLGRGLDKYFAQQERGTGYGHRPEVRRPFVRKKQEPPPCCSLRQAILLSFKSEIRTFKSYGMIRVPNASATSTEGWADWTSIEDNTID
jgi:hypothetical protein